MRSFFSSWGMAGMALFAALSSTNYTLNNYGFGSGGTSSSTSTNYALNGTSGETGNVQSSSTNYLSRSGNNNSQQAQGEGAPTFTNPANYYDKLQFIINPGANPSDTKYSIAISTDNFVTTKYVQPDNTIGSTKTISNYQTYAAWGGAGGQNVVGLSPSTTYYIKVNSFQGSFTETAYGPVATAATVAPSISFVIDVSATDTHTLPPYATSFGNLLPATTTTAPQKVWVSLNTNGDTGGYVYVSSLYGGLKSPTNNYTITSASADLSSASTGYGAQGSTATQTSGGPFTINAPYAVASQNVGAIATKPQVIFSTTQPIVAGRASFYLLAKAAALTPEASDYTDSLTVTAAASF